MGAGANVVVRTPLAFIMMKTITISRTVKTAVEVTPRVLEVAAMFGLGVDDQRERAVVPRCEIPLPHLNGRSGIVFVTGPSGSGKSTILKLIAETVERGCGEQRCTIVRFDQLPALPDVSLVDVFCSESMPLDRALMLLSLTGLNEAFVMLRRPSQLSDGQRYRLRLAQAMALLCASAVPRTAQDLRQNPTHLRSASPASVMVNGDESHHNDHGERAMVDAAVVIADEFGSTLDRITAMTVARNLRRWVTKHSPLPVSFIVATAHDDLLEALEPDVLVWKGLGEAVEVVTR